MLRRVFLCVLVSLLAASVGAEDVTTTKTVTKGDSISYNITGDGHLIMSLSTGGTFSGKFTGNGAMTLTSPSTPRQIAYYTNDLSAFTGTVTVEKSMWFSLKGSNYGSESADWVVNALTSGETANIYNTGLLFDGNAGTYKFGTLAGNGILRVNTANTYNLKIGAADSAGESTTFEGGINRFGGGNFTVEKVGAGTWIIASPTDKFNSRMYSTGTADTYRNDYTGATTISEGTLQLGDWHLDGETEVGGTGGILGGISSTETAASTVTAVTIKSGATLAFAKADGEFEFINNTTSNAATTVGTVTTPAGTISVVNPDSSVKMTGSVAGTFTKTGSGTLELTGNLTDVNATVSAGTINLFGQNFTSGSAFTATNDGSAKTLTHTAGTAMTFTDLSAIAASGTSLTVTPITGQKVTVSTTEKFLGTLKIVGDSLFNETRDTEVWTAENPNKTGNVTLEDGTFTFNCKNPFGAGSVLPDLLTLKNVTVVSQITTNDTNLNFMNVGNLVLEDSTVEAAKTGYYFDRLVLAGKLTVKGTSTINSTVLFRTDAYGVKDSSGNFQSGIIEVAEGGTLKLNRMIRCCNVGITIKKQGAGTVVYTGSGFQEPNTYSLNIQAGTWQIGNYDPTTKTGGTSGELAANLLQNVTLSGGTLTFARSTAQNITWPKLTASGGAISNVNPDAAITLNTPISGSGGFTKSGAGEIILTKASQMTAGTSGAGTVTVAEGTLHLTEAGSLTNANVTVKSSGKLTLESTSTTVAKNLTLENGAALRVTSSQNIDGVFTAAEGSSLSMNLTGGTKITTANTDFKSFAPSIEFTLDDLGWGETVSGNLNELIVGSSSSVHPSTELMASALETLLQQTTAGGTPLYAGSYDLTTGAFSVGHNTAGLPEPATWILLLIGLGMVKFLSGVALAKKNA